MSENESQLALTPFQSAMPHYNDLGATLAHALRCLDRGASDRRSGFHTANVATLGADGFPAVRTVVLRAFHASTRAIEFHTDIRSGKFDEIEHDRRISVHFYDATQKIQLRLRCMAEIHRNDAKSIASWQKSRAMSLICYAQTISPGAFLPNPLDAEQSRLAETDAYANFGVVSASIVSLEWLYLAAAGHRRALFDWRTGDLVQTWLAP